MLDLDKILILNERDFEFLNDSKYRSSNKYINRYSYSELENEIFIIPAIIVSWFIIGITMQHVEKFDNKFIGFMFAVLYLSSFVFIPYLLYKLGVGVKRMILNRVKTFDKFKSNQQIVNEYSNLKEKLRNKIDEYISVSSIQLYKEISLSNSNFMKEIYFNNYLLIDKYYNKLWKPYWNIKPFLESAKLIIESEFEDNEEDLKPYSVPIYISNPKNPNEIIIQDDVINNKITLTENNNIINDEKVNKNKIIAKKNNWDELNEKKSKIGNLGGLYVLEIEKSKINLLNPEFLNKIFHASNHSDSYGYDILSFDENGNEIFIEVKTTVNKNPDQFFITKNELLVMSEKDEAYHLYFVYEFDEIKNSGKIKILKGEKEIMNNISLEPLNYSAKLKT